MKIISGKTIFASLVFLLIISFIANNFLNDNNFGKKGNKIIKNSEKQEKVIGIQIRQQNQKGDQLLIVADTLEEIESKEKKVILENSFTTINQKGILTKISAGTAIITNNYKNFSFSNKVRITKKTRKFSLQTETLSGTFQKGNYYTNDDVMIVAGNTIVKGKGLKIKKNGEYIKIIGKASLKMLLPKGDAYQ